LDGNHEGRITDLDDQISSLQSEMGKIKEEKRRVSVMSMYRKYQEDRTRVIAD
jgi:hypothetical protein